jgi:hypothetical protein
MLISDVVQGQKYYSLLAEFASGFVYNSSTRNAINRIYNQNQYFYYEKAIASPAYNDYVINMSDVKQALYARRALGVLICAEEDKNIEKKLIDIARRYYPSLYRLAKHADDKHLTCISDVVFNLSKPNFRANTNIMCYLIIKMYSPGKIPLNLYSILKDHLGNLSNGSFNKYGYMEPYMDNLAQIKKTLKNQIGQLKGFEDAYTSELPDIRQAIGAIAWSFEFEEINGIQLLSELILNETQIDEIIVSYLLCDKSLGFEDIKPTIVYSIIIKSLLIRYKESRELFFKINQETQYMAMQRLEQQNTLLREKNQGLQKEAADYKERYLNLRKDFEKLQEQNTAKVRKQYSTDLAETRAQVIALELELEKEKSYRQELYNLRSLMFSIEHEDRDFTLSPNKSLNDYADKRIFILGGTPDWRQRMSKAYTNVSCVDGFSENINLNLFGNVDYIFFFYKFMGHPVYYKVIDYIRINRIPFGR